MFAPQTSFFYRLPPFLLFLLSLFSPLTSKSRRDLFIILLIIFYFFLSLFGTDSLRVTHLFPIIPLILLLIGRTLSLVPSKLMPFLLGLFIFFNLALLLEVSQIVEMGEFMGLPKTDLLVKSTKNSSTIVCPNRICVVLRAHYGENKRIYDIPHEPDEPITYEPEELTFEQKFGIFYRTLTEGDVMYVLPSAGWFGERIPKVLHDRLKSAALHMNKTVRLVKIINTTLGQPVYELWQAD
jgi:hypothetical protein